MSISSKTQLPPRALPFLCLPCRHCADIIHESFELLRAPLIEGHGLPGHELDALLAPQAHDAPHPARHGTEIIFPGPPPERPADPTELVFPDSDEPPDDGAGLAPAEPPTELVFAEDAAAEDHRPAHEGAAPEAEPPADRQPPDLAPAPTAEPHPDEALLEPESAAEPTATAPILLVLPENDLFTDIVAGYFAQGGWDIALAHDGPQADAALRRHGARLAILDFALPGVPALLDHTKLDAATNPIPATALLPHGTDPNRPDGVRIQAELELAEPFALPDLLTAVDRLLDRTTPDEARPPDFHLNFVLPSTRDELDRATAFAARLFGNAGLAAKGQTELLTAFREAVGNAIQHGNLSNADRTVYVQYRRDPAQVTLVIHDEGDGFDPDFYLEQAREHDATHLARVRRQQGGQGGLGILMIHRCTDSLEYTNGGNTLTISKRLPPAGPGPS